MIIFSVCKHSTYFWIFKPFAFGVVVVVGRVVVVVVDTGVLVESVFGSKGVAT